MKMLNKFKIHVLSLIVLFLATGCGEEFFDINTDPDAAIADEANPDLLFAPAITTVSANRMADAGFFSGLWAQQMSQNGASALFRGIENFNQFQVIVQNLWNVVYEDGVSNLRFAEIAAQNSVPPSANAEAQAKIFAAWQYFYLTQFFGDIPFSEALNGIDALGESTVDSPRPDIQRDVFVGIVALVDEGLALIDPDNGGTPITEGDLLYGGDLNSWIRFGNTLKLKALMFLAGREASFQTEVAALINSSALFIEEASQNAEAPFFATAGNENNFFKFAVTIQPDGSRESDTFYANVELLDIMDRDDRNDPRIRIYFQPSSTATTDLILGNISGAVGFNTEVSEVSFNILREDFPDRMLTAEETHLYRAEAYARGYVSGAADLAAANTSLLKAIEVSFDFWNNNAPQGPQISDTDRAIFLSSVDLTLLSQDDAINRIYEEHYTTLFTRGSEVWTLQRRVDFPALTAPAQALLGNLPQRYFYPNEETASNEFITNDGVQRTDPLWFKENQ